MEGEWKEGEGKERKRGWGRRGKRGEERGREGRGERQSYMQVITQATIYTNSKKCNSWDAYHLGPRLQGVAAAYVSAGILSI